LDDKVLDYLVDHHNSKLRSIEREVCHCFKGFTLTGVSIYYPKCVNELSSNLRTSEEAIDVYWDVIEGYMKEKYPELLMEAYMMG
jgi:hypothetical protein